MRARLASLVTLTVAGAATLVVTAPATAVGVTSSNITSPAAGAHYTQTGLPPA
jgi:hypothetical protein